MMEFIERSRSVLQATPGIRRAAPALSATWHSVDRSHVVYETRRRAWQVQHRRRKRFPLRIAFTPEAPRYFHAAYRLCVRLNVDVVPLAEADVVLHWADVTIRNDPPPGLDPRAINARVCDISKRHVGEVHGQVFGYDLGPEPGATEVVEKSDTNSTHDGRIVDRPSGAPGMVTERLIDNRLDEHLVSDFRVSVKDGGIAWTFRRYRPLGDRFMQSGRNLLAVVVDADAYFSADEQTRLLALCDAIGADWAELDVLRDGPSGRLYVVDVNPTPAFPITGVDGTQLATYWRLEEQGFAALLRGHARVTTTSA
jgi:hypothetical protein